MEKRFFILVGLGCLCLLGCHTRPSTPNVRVGCKNFPEQLLLGEIISQYLEKQAYKVDRKFGFASTQLIHAALAHNDLDLYVEYSGTAREVILKTQVDGYKSIGELYRKLFHADWLSPLGLNNGYVLVTKQTGAVPLSSNKLSMLRDTTPFLRAGMNAEFLERPDGYPLLQNVYGIQFKEVVTLDAGLIFRALDTNKVDLICAFATDGALQKEGQYVIWDDDKAALPRYDASIVLKLAAQQTFPDLRNSLEKLSGSFSNQQMRRLNHALENGEPLEKLAADYLQMRQ